MGANLITNGNFEGGSLAAPWSSTKSTLAYSALAAETGAGGMLIDSAYNWCPYGALYPLDSAALQNGTMYEFGARIRLAAGESGEAKTLMGLIVNGGDPIWLDGYDASYEGKAYPDRWTTLKGIHQAAFSVGDDVKLCISGAAGKKLYLDNAYARALTTAEVGYQPPASLNADELVHADGNRLVIGSSGETFTLKGVNVYLYNPGSNDGTALENLDFKNANESSYQEISSLGFNTVRLMLAYSLFEDNDNPGVYKEEGWATLDRHIQWAKANGLRVMLDMHVPPGGYQSASGFHGFDSRPDLQQRLEDLWVAIASRYRNEATVLAYDLINEPWVNNWFAYAQILIDKIRAVDPHHLIDVEVSFHSSDIGMYKLADNNILYDEHWYDPWTWAGSHTNNTPYVSDLESYKQALRDGEGLSKFYDAATDSFTVPFNIGEYGVVFEKYEIDGVNGLQWLQDANDAFDHFGLNRQLFAYNETNFGIYRGWNSYPNEHTITTEALKAALPSVNGGTPVTPPPPPPAATETDLSASLSHSPLTAEVGQTVTYSVSINNLGSGATDARVELVLGSEASVVAVGSGCSDLGDRVSCAQMALPAGAQRNWGIDASYATAGSYQAAATAYSDTLTDPNSANNQASDSITINEPTPPAVVTADMELTSFDLDATQLDMGRVLGINFVIENLGDGVASNAGFSMALPAGVEWVSGAAECGVVASRLSCSFGGLGVWASRNRYVYLRLNQAGDVNVTGVATADSEDPDLSNNSITQTVTVVDPNAVPAGGSADMDLVKLRITSSTPRVGRALGFNFKLLNRGGDLAENVRYVMPLPTGFSWVSGASECGVTGSEVVCNFGDLASGASRNRYLYLRPSAAGAVTASGSALSDTADPNSANDSRSVQFNVQ